MDFLWGGFNGVSHTAHCEKDILLEQERREG